MFIDGTDPNNPIYLVLPTGQYIRDTDGNPIPFYGEAVENHESGYLVDEHGNFLFHNNAYIPSPHTSTEGKEQEKKWTFILLVILLVLALVVSGGLFAHYLASKDSGDSPSASPTNTQNTDSPDIVREPPPTQTTPASRVQLPPEAYPGAGSADIPANAVYNGDLSGGLSLKSPSDNIWCFSYKESLSCSVRSWDGTQYGYSSDCYDGYCWPYNTVTIYQTGTPQLDVQTNGWAEVVLPYGQIAYNGNWVCASEQNGMTCWSRASGHGFFVNRDGYKAF